MQATIIFYLGHCSGPTLVSLLLPLSPPPPQHPQTGGSATCLVLTCHASHRLTVLAQCFSFSLRSAQTSHSHRPGSCSCYTRPPDGDISSEVTQTTLLFLPVLSLLSVLCHCRSSIFVSTLSSPEKKKKKARPKSSGLWPISWAQEPARS